MKTYLYILFLSILIISISGCGTSSNAYLKSKNPNIQWMDKNAVKKKREFPTSFAYQDENYLYCYGVARTAKIETFNGSKKDGVSFGNTESRSLSVSAKGSPIYYQVEKKNLSIKKSIPSVEKEKTSLEDVFWNSNAGWTIFTTNSNSKHIDYNAKSINFTGEFIKKKLFTLDLEKKRQFISDGYGYNEDSTTLSFYNIQYKGKDDQLIFLVKTFDFKTMDLKWEKTFDFPYEVKKRKDVENIKIKFTSNGEPHFVFKSYFEKRKEKRKGEDGEVEANYVFNYFILKSDGNIEEHKIDLDGLFVKSLVLSNSKFKNPVICAYTYKKNNYRELKGLVFKQVDLENKKISTLKEIEFNTKKLIVFNDNGKELKQANIYEWVDNLKFQDMIISSDNSIYSIGEINDYYQRQSSKSKMEYNEKLTNKSPGSSTYGSTSNTTGGFERTTQTTSSSYVHSGNILITKISPEGKEDWSIIIPKAQNVPRLVDKEDESVSKFIFHSFKAFEINGKLHLFFNDNPDNYKESTIKKVKVWNINKTSLVHAIVSPDGKYELIEALGKKDHPKVPFINSINKIDDNTVFLFDTKTFGLLKIDN